MARKARQRISYVLPLADQAVGHRLGVNGIAIDEKRSLLYSGGRDGVICSWNLDLDFQTSSVSDDGECQPGTAKAALKSGESRYWKQIQAHTHWINDVVLAHDGLAVVSASSDVSVKLWRPHSEDGNKPFTIGLHSDYVKCLASPSTNSPWIASGGLDRKICLWDLRGNGHHLQISTADEEVAAKGSIYALDTNNTLIASGGPENIVKVWDARTAKLATKFVGHTDNVRSILISQEGDTIITASSDQTVKVWSMTAGRCMYTLTMHNDSVWSLYSRNPQLSVFYSGDRSGLVAKTDTRGVSEMDDGLSVAICQEQQGVSKVVAAGDFIWTATSSSNINRWHNIETRAGVQVPESMKSYRWSAVSRARAMSASKSVDASNNDPGLKTSIPLSCVLRLSNFSPFPPLGAREMDRSTSLGQGNAKRASNATFEADTSVFVPLRSSPAECIEGQNGLTKHVMLNDRRRVLALDTAGEVVMWDIVRCIPTKSFGKRNLDEVVKEVNTVESIAHWCAVDTRTGSLTCVLEQNHCFDAEMYADELEEAKSIDFREDQRINLGKWVLRYLFAGLIDEEIRRDDSHRHKVTSGNIPKGERTPEQGIEAVNERKYMDGNSASTPKASHLYSHHPLKTPGLSIGVVPPNAALPNPGMGPGTQLSPTQEEGSNLQRTASQTQSKSSWERASDYFSSKPQPPAASQVANVPSKSLATPTENTDEGHPMSPTDPEKETPTKDSSTSFSKRLRIPFTARKSGKSQTAEAKQAIVEEKTDDSDSKSSKVEETIFEDSFEGTIQRIRQKYVDDANKSTEIGPSGITPSLPNETPVLKPPLATRIVIQEDHPDSGEVADLFEGTVGTVQSQADLIEKAAPFWLGEVLLRKDVVKVLFVLEPYEGLLPSLPTAAGENDRLNANRMLRARKILAYVSERLQAAPGEPEVGSLRPEDYLELYCQNQLIPPMMTLATVRAYIWRSSNDVVLQYRANGKRNFLPAAKKSPAEQRKDTTTDSNTDSAANATEKKLQA